MQVHSIISNAISEENLQTGHLSIRFMSNGFSLLLEDKLSKPVVLNHFTSEPGISLISHITECEDWLVRQTLITNFTGEVSIVVNDIPSVLVPESLFSGRDASIYLDPLSPLNENDFIKYKLIKNRPFYIVYSIPAIVSEIANKFSGKVRIMSPNEVLLSMADHVNAADHQRGFALVEIQDGFLGILSIKNDEIEIVNNLEIGSADELVYHTLNTLERTGFKRKECPLFFSGIESSLEMKTLKRFIAKVLPLSYHILGIQKSFILENVLLAEATKCE